VEPCATQYAAQRTLHTEAKQHSEPGVETFNTVLDVTEPMGMETLIYFTMEGTQVCGRVNPMPARTMAARFDWLWTSTICTC
jgi:hypothetical protein